MAWWMAIPAAVAAAGGIASMIKGATTKTPGAYQPDPRAFQTQQGVGPWWQKAIREPAGLDQRKKQNAALQYLQATATGDQSIAGMQGARSVADAQQAIASQTARLMGGRHNPALARGAQYAMGQAAQGIAGQAAIDAAKEKQAALQAYLSALQAGRGQDIQQTLGLQQLGLQDKFGQARSLQALEAMKAGQTGYAQKSAQAERQFWGQMGTGLLSTAASMGKMAGKS